MKNINMVATSLIVLTNLSFLPINYNHELDADINITSLTTENGENLVISSNIFITSQQAKQIKDKHELMDLNQAYVIKDNGMIVRPTILIDDANFNEICSGLAKAYNIKYVFYNDEEVIENYSIIRVDDYMS